MQIGCDWGDQEDPSMKSEKSLPESSSVCLTCVTGWDGPSQPLTARSSRAHVPHSTTTQHLLGPELDGWQSYCVPRVTLLQS